LFSDNSHDGDDATDDYYDMKDYQYLTGEEKIYKKTPQGGLVAGVGKKGAPKPGKAGGKQGKENKKKLQNDQKVQKVQKAPKAAKKTDAAKAQKAKKTTKAADSPTRAQKQAGRNTPASGTQKANQRDRSMKIVERVDKTRRQNSGYPTVTVTQKKWVNGKWVDV
jgi:hypothetical protein